MSNAGHVHSIDVADRTSEVGELSYGRRVVSSILILGPS